MFQSSIMDSQSCNKKNRRKVTLQMSDEHIQDDEISLLDLALTVAENLRLLIIGPIAAGLIALGVSSLLPKTFESVAGLDPVIQYHRQF